MSLIAGQLTAVVITFNEEDNLARTLGQLGFAKQVLVVDSGSTDRTLEIAASFANTKVVTRPFDTFAGQCNFALTQVKTPWVLSLDADYVLSDDLVREISALNDDGVAAGYRAGFVYKIYDKLLRGTLYPPRVVLYRRQNATYRDYGHGHKVHVTGLVRDLSARVFHDDRKPLSRWFAAQQKYARREADYLLSTPRHELKASDRIRLAMIIAPVVVPLHVLIFKGALFDGLAGWHYVFQRLLAETLIALELLDRRLR